MGNDSSSLKRFSIKGSAHGTSSKQGSSTQSQTMPVVSPNQGQAQASAPAPAQTSAPASAAPPAQKSPTSAAAPANADANGNGNGAGAAAPSADDIANAPTVEETATAAFGSQIEANEKKNKVGLEDFALLKTVGKGSFGKVIQVRKKDTGKIYAMKVLKKDQVIRRKQYEHTMAERRILEAIDHPFIVSLRFAFQTNSKLYMIFDYFAGGELFHYLSQGGRFSEDRARLYAAEIALALEHVHALNIIYRDLKPENLLLDSDGHIRVTDFGLSKENVTDDSVKSFCGTPEYLAPEVLKRQKYGKAVDWWSLGTLLYEMIAGLPPYYDRNRERMYKKILGAELRFPSHMSPEAKSICRGMLMREPEERLGYRGAQEVKAHPFFAFLNFDDVLAKRVEPPFKPSVADDEDTRNVDKSFINMPAEISPTLAEESGIAAAAGAKFDGFTFVAKSVLEGARGGDFAAKNNTEEEAELSEYQRRLAAGNGTIPE